MRSIPFGRYVGSINSLDCRRLLLALLTVVLDCGSISNIAQSLLLYLCLDAGSSGGIYSTKHFVVSPGDLLIELVTL